MTARVPIRGDTLAWARASLGLDEAELGRAANVSAEQVGRFEANAVQPTLNQLRSMAKRLDRTIAFFLAPPPERSDVPSTVDYRRANANAHDPKLATEMKRADAHRQTLLDLVGAPERRLGLNVVTRQNAEEEADHLRTLLGLAPDFVPRETQTSQVFNFWRGLIEDHGVLVFQTTGISLASFRGLSIYHDVLPVVLLNGADSANGRIFTLFHELGHLAARTSGICELEEAVAIEAVCNAFAASVLIPRGALARWLRTEGEPDPASVARHFKVSTLAAAVRLRSLNHISDEDLDEIRETSDREWESVRAERAEKPGFVPQWTLRNRDLGPTYVNAVLTALQAEQVNWVDATYMLDARVPTIERMQAEFRRRGAS